MKSALIRYLIIALLLAVLVAGLLLFIGGDRFLIVQPGSADSVVPTGGYKLSYQILTGAVIAAVVGTVVLWSLLTFVWDLPGRIKTGVSKRKRGQALEAMEDAMIAASSGNADKARKKAARARALVGRPALGQIMSAQAAEVSGDPAEAEAHYKTMMKNAKTKPIAQRGLATLAQNRGDLDEAIAQASTAYAENKDAKWAFDILFSAQIGKGDWDAALETLGSGERRKHISKDIAARRSAVIKTAIAQRMDAAGQRDSAKDMAGSVTTDAPGFAPGVALAARLFMQSGEDERAAKVIEKAWKEHPHPALALAYRDLQEGEPDKQRARRMKFLQKQNNTHRESVLLAVQEALRAGDGAAAWEALQKLIDSEEPSGRLCELASAAQTLMGNDKDAQLWMARAASAPIEADWSDLDPVGPAFDYTDADWRRMVFAYGDNGALIHPRHERFEKARTAISASIPEAAKPTRSVVDKDEAITPPPDFIKDA